MIGYNPKNKIKDDSGEDEKRERTTKREKDRKRVEKLRIKSSTFKISPFVTLRLLILTYIYTLTHSPKLITNSKTRIFLIFSQ